VEAQKTLELLNFNFSIPNIFNNPLFLVDILIVFLILYWVYRLLKNTKAVRILYGVIILAIFMYISSFLHLTVLNLVLTAFLTVILVAIPVVFQPELRNALEKIGRTTGLRAAIFKKPKHPRFLNVILETVKRMSEENIGGIIAIQRKTGLSDYLKTGISLDANISKELILACFTEDSPLHDGAVIIFNNRILGASCILPLSEDDSTKALGTRHKAAVGLSEETDAVSIVVSEKSGEISLAIEGIFEKNINIDDLGKKLKSLLKDHGSNPLKFVNRLNNEQ